MKNGGEAHQLTATHDIANVVANRLAAWSEVAKDALSENTLRTYRIEGDAFSR